MIAATITSVSATGSRRVHHLQSLLTPAARELAKAEANAWIKRFRLVDYGGQTMRQRFTYRAESLWWFTEIYLHKTRVFERAIETLLALEAALDQDAPARLSLASSDTVARQAALAFAAAKRIGVDLEGTEHDSDRRERLLSFAVGPSALLSRLKQPTRRSPARTAVAAFVHTAFWRDEHGRSSGGRESYVGPVLDQIAMRVGGSLAAIGLGPRRNFRSRRWWDPILGRPGGRAITPIEQLAPRQSIEESLELWRNRSSIAEEVVSGPGVRLAAEWRGYDLWPTVSTVLRRAADVQWPWSARSMDEARAALDHLRPDVVVTYAEAGGWGRALILEARRAGIPSIGLQHGFIYRHWLNYRHEADEMQPDGADRGFPYPDTTLVFDGFAAATLRQQGHFPGDAVLVTGSPRLDELAAQAAAVSTDLRNELRRSLGVAGGDRLILLAAKHREIAAELPEIVSAIDSMPGVRCVIKPHPGERADVYNEEIAASARVALAPDGLELGMLFGAADAILTMNSTAAIDAMTLGLPAIVVGLPNNLTPFVEAGVMAGAGPGGLRMVIESVLYDREVRESLAGRGRRFVEQYDIKAVGDAAERAADEVLSRTRRTQGP